MRGNEKNLRLLIHKLHEMKGQGSLETTKVAQIVRSVRMLRRAVRENDRRLIESTVDELCRLFIKTLDNDDRNDATDG
jgi:hypothetical protein